MGLSEGPTPAATPFPDKKIDASRTDILVIAFGILFLVSQLCLIIWILARPHAFAGKKEQRKTTVTSPSTSKPNRNSTNANNNIDSPKPRQKFRRSSTWNGGLLERQYPHRQGKSGGLDKLGGLGTPLSSPESDFDSDHINQKGIRDMGIMAETLAPPMSATPPAHFINPLGSHDADSEPELKEINPRKVWKEMGLMAASIIKPSSPRSPRLNAADQAAVMEALTADDEGTGAPAPTPAVVEDGVTLASGFDDPLGVNRWLAPSEKKTDTVLGPSGSELRGRSV